MENAPCMSPTGCHNQEREQILDMQCNREAKRMPCNIHSIGTGTHLQRFHILSNICVDKKNPLRLLDSPCKRTQSVHFYYLVTSVIHFDRPQLFIYLSKKAACLCASHSIVDHTDERILDALRFSFVPERHEHTHRKVASIKDERKTHVAVKRMKKSLKLT